MDTTPRHVRAPARVSSRPTWLISRAFARSSGLLNDAFEASGDGLRTYHYRLLAALEQVGPSSQAELGRGTGIDRSDVAAAVALLEQHRLLKRSIDAADRRRKIVTITAAGTQRLAALDQVVADVQEQVLSPLSAAERRQLVRLLQRLADSD